MMQRMLLCTLVFLLLVGCSSQSGATDDVSFRKRWVQGVPANVVIVNLNCANVKVTPAMARRGAGTSEGFGGMLSRLQPAAAITGTFFCVRSLIPVGDLVVGGNVLSFGSVGTGICFTADNQVDFVLTKQGQATGWAAYESVICGGPRLVRDGIAYVNPRAEGFRDPALFRQAARTAIGVTRENKLLLVSVNRGVYLSHMARIMRDLGAVDAINLDGGSSTALYCKGVVPSHPARRMTNLVVVYDSLTRYNKVRTAFCPGVTVTPKPTGQTGERDEVSSRLSITDSKPAEPEESTRSAEPGTPEPDTEIQEGPAQDPQIDRTDPDSDLAAPNTDESQTNKEAAACESGPLPRRISDHTGPSRRTSSS